VARGPAYDLDAIDSLGREFRPSKLAWDLDDRAPPRRYLRPVNGPVDLHNPPSHDDLPPLTPGAGANRAEPQHPARRQRPDKSHPPQSNRSNSNLRRWLTCAAGGLAFAVSFVIAMRLTQPVRPPTSAMMVLAGSTISDLGSLIAAVKLAGLRGTPDVKGSIDELTRHDNDHVTLTGWAAEIADSDSPLAVMVFVDGRNKLTMQTSGRRPDVTAALGLSDAASANVAFQGSLTCSRGQRLIVVAVAENDVYGHFGTRLCP
jgi:hypothetical protein